MEPAQAAGVWANLALASHTEHEFTLDFVRMDPLVPRGVLVARVAVSPVLFVQLMELLPRIWQDWAESQLPKEAQGGSGEEDSGAQGADSPGG
jgi:Protein of unknown function (DUF3467)